MTAPISAPGFWTVGRVAIALGVLAFLAVVVTLGDPGITSDEPLDVRVGQRYVEAVWKGKARFDRVGVRAMYADNAQHPPLGRWLVGLSSVLAEPFEGMLGGADPFSVHPARLAPALAFGLLVGLTTLAAGRRHGRATAIGTGFAVLMMPRLFSHAHFATLDTLLCLFWVGALLAVEHAAETKRPVLGAGLAGFIWGLALLTKIHAWLLPPVVVVWLIARLGWRRGSVAFLVWSAVGLIVFFGGWPWLWYETLPRLRGFLNTSVERLALRVQYFGAVYLDRDVPWHYPWVYFAVTVPVGLHVLGAIGVWDCVQRRKEYASSWADLGAIVLLLVVFSTRAPVYDGERLFLPAFFLWALLIGRGFSRIWEQSRQKWKRGLLVAFFAAQGLGLVLMHPFGLSYYNLFVGGLPGAEKLGLELTYWGDSVSPALLRDLTQEARPEQSVALVPTLHHIQPTSLMTPGTMAKRLVFRDDQDLAKADWLIVYRRTAYWPEGFNPAQAGFELHDQQARLGVWLARTWRKKSGPERAGVRSK